jgi:type II secretory pathway pseudopilin PulG
MIELLLVFGVLGILLVIVLVASQSIRGRATRSKALQFSRSIHNWLVEESVGVWNFNEGSGTTAADTSTKNQPLAIDGATWIADGVLDSALRFNGSTNTITLAAPLFTTVPQHVTASVWLRQNAIGGTQTVLSQGLHGDFKITIASDGEIEAHYRNSAGAWNVIDSGIAIDPENWHHAAFVWDSQENEAKLFVDGRLRTTVQPGTELYDGTGSLTIGSFQGSSEFFNGDIDEVELYTQSF